MNQSIRPLAPGSELLKREKSGEIIFFELAFLMALPVLALLFYQELRRQDLNTLCALSTVAVFGVGWWLHRLTPRGIWSMPFTYFVVFACFHFGLTLVTVSNAPINEDFNSYISRWFYNDFTHQAIVLVNAGLLGFALGARLGLLGRFAGMNVTGDERDEHIGHSFTRLGFLLMTGSLGVWFFIVIRSAGFGGLVGAYKILIEIMSGDSMVFAGIHFCIGLGAIFLAAGPPSKLRVAGFLTFAIWALFAVPLGLRGEVMFPLCTALTVSARRRLPISGRRATLTVLGLLVLTLSLIAFVRGYRQTGLEGVGQERQRFNPMDALAEMGQTLRTVSLVVEWREEGDAFLNGGSYWAPFDRGLARVLPGWSVDPPDSENDDRLLSRLMKRRVSGLAFSPVAEAYRNFGVLGVPLMMMLVGFILGFLERQRPSHLIMASVGVVYFPLLYQVRNSFVQLPAQTLVGFIVMFVAIMAANTTWKRRQKQR